MLLTCLAHWILHLAPTHRQSTSIWLYFRFILPYSLPISHFVRSLISPPFSLSKAYMTSSMIFSEPFQNLKAPTFQTLFFLNLQCSIHMSFVFDVLRPTAFPNITLAYFAMNIHTIYYWHPFKYRLSELGENAPYAILCATFSEKIYQHLWATLVPANYPQAF